MSNNVKNCIYELEELVADMHRRAALLDSLLCQIEEDVDESDPVWAQLAVRCQIEHYEATKKHRGFDVLNKREEELITELLESLVS